MYTQLLKLCGFEAEDINKEKPRINRAFQILEIGAEDIARAEARVKKYFDIELLGIRKILGICIKELIDLVLAKEEGKKVVYIGQPTTSKLGLVMTLASADVYCHAPQGVLGLAMGQIFDKIGPIIRSAEHHGMPPGLAHCSLSQARLGGIAKGIVPIPDLTVTSGFYCDHSAKTDELIHEVYGVPNIFIDSCIDANWDEWPEVSPQRVKYFGGEINRALGEIQKALGIEITEDVFCQAQTKGAKLNTSLQEINELMRGDPQPLSQVDLNLCFHLRGCTDQRILEEAGQALSILAKEVKQRVDEGRGVMKKGAPRVLIGALPIADPSLIHIIESSGLAIPASVWSVLNTRPYISKGENLSPTERSAATQLMAGTFHSTAAQVWCIKEVLRDWAPDGYIHLYPFSCRVNVINSLMVKKAVEADPGIPVLALEADLYDSNNHSTEVLKTSVETFAEMLRVARAVKAG
ncbi:2-hydroxyacyl-CoA dehydratase [Chloroflexota bacterium]